jgi:8-oxo-dGTP pyrophosphatase MutT (NUDIX family)
MLDFLAMGPWAEDGLDVRRVSASRRIVPDVERQVDAAWAAAKSRLGDKLFDGPMCRLESWRAGGGRLDLALSETSYRPFLGTNLTHPELAATHGADVLANPVGLSPALLTRDGHLVMGRRNDSVAYYPWHVHPFAGALEPRDVPRIFDGVRRELAEEVGLAAADTTDLRMLGIVRDRALLQPEFIFAAVTRLTLAELERGLDDAEHHGVWSAHAIEPSVDAVLSAIGTPSAERMTPVAVATLLLFGRSQFGGAWFDAHRRRLAP